MSSSRISASYYPCPTSQATKGNLRAGQEVRLRSDGPRMTILDVGRDTDLVFCRWMAEDGTIDEASFPVQTLLTHAPAEPTQERPE